MTPVTNPITRQYLALGFEARTSSRRVLPVDEQIRVGLTMWCGCCVCEVWWVVFFLGVGLRGGGWEVVHASCDMPLLVVRPTLCAINFDYSFSFSTWRYVCSWYESGFWHSRPRWKSSKHCLISSREDITKGPCWTIGSPILSCFLLPCETFNLLWFNPENPFVGKKLKF